MSNLAKGDLAVEIDDLSVTFATDGGDVHAVDGVSLSVRAGEVLAIVGESGSVRIELRKTCLNMMREELEPITFADSTNASDLMRTTSERTTLKYCGMKTTVIEIAAARMPPNSCERPPEITIDITIASSSDGKA
jgi:ABC-type dipeptide/oligopeptide/nickel transport system ATPase component